MEQKWIPIEEQIPKEDEYILLSFENFSIPVIGRFENGAFYAGDEDEPLVKQDMYVNAWMPLPERYGENEEYNETMLQNLRIPPF